MTLTFMKNNEKLVHIVCEIVILFMLTYYFNRKNSNLFKHIEDISSRLEEQEDEIESLKEQLLQISKFITSEPPSNMQPQPPSNMQPQPPSNMQPQPPSNMQHQPPSNMQPQPPSNMQPQPPSNMQPPPRNIQHSPNMQPQPRNMQPPRLRRQTNDFSMMNEGVTSFSFGLPPTPLNVGFMTMQQPEKIDEHNNDIEILNEETNNAETSLDEEVKQELQDLNK